MNEDELQETAIIYSKHKQINELLKVLNASGIPYNSKRKVDIIYTPEINCILNVFEYLDKESDKGN